MKREIMQNEWIKAKITMNIVRKFLKILNEKNNQVTQEFQFDNAGLLVTYDGNIVVPKEKVNMILKMNHDHILAGHLGTAKSLARIKRQYLWSGLGNDVKIYVSNRITCAKRKAYGSHKAPLNPLSLDGTIAFSPGSVGECGDAAALCGDVTCHMSLPRSLLLISGRKPRHIVVELPYAGSEFDGVLSYDSPHFLCFFDGTFAALWWEVNKQGIAVRDRVTFDVPSLRGHSRPRGRLGTQRYDPVGGLKLFESS